MTVGRGRGPVGFRAEAHVEHPERTSPEQAHELPAIDKLAPLDIAATARLRAMVDANFDFIFRTLRGLGVPAADAEDANQKVFLIAAGKLASIATGSERAFLFATARGVAANARRASARNREDANEDALTATLDGAPSPEEAAARSQAKARLASIMNGMDEDARAVFLLFELEGLTMVEIAKLLDTPPGTVASRLRRAREHFQRETAELTNDGRIS